MKTTKELREFVTFPFSIYNKKSNWVPPLTNDELESMDRDKNPVFKNAEARFFLALKNGKPVGRIAAIINHIEINEQAKTKNHFYRHLEVRLEIRLNKMLISQTYCKK